MSKTNSYRVSVAVAPMLAQAQAQSICTSEALYGALLTALGTEKDWIRVYHQADQYEGFIHQAQIQPVSEVSNSHAVSHWVHSRSTLLFQQPDLKSTVIHRVPFGSELLLGAEHELFRETSCGYFVWSAHCLPIGQPHPLDPLSLARAHFLGTPYLWGGRSPEGIDCSGLIQMLAYSQGISIPRDSGDQELFLNSAVADQDRQALDLVYWPGHTGILVSADKLLHSTAHTLDCRIEPLQDVINRAGEPSSVKRLFKIVQ